MATSDFHSTASPLWRAGRWGVWPSNTLRLPVLCTAARSSWHGNSVTSGSDAVSTVATIFWICDLKSAAAHEPEPGLTAQQARQAHAAAHSWRSPEDSAGLSKDKHTMKHNMWIILQLDDDKCVKTVTQTAYAVIEQMDGEVVKAGAIADVVIRAAFRHRKAKSLQKAVASALSTTPVYQLSLEGDGAGCARNRAGHESVISHYRKLFSRQGTRALPQRVPKNHEVRSFCPRSRFGQGFFRAPVACLRY